MGNTSILMGWRAPDSGKDKGLFVMKRGGVPLTTP
jgi:hypothetical protein